MKRILQRLFGKSQAPEIPEVVVPATRHWTDGELDRWELAHGCTLPESYRVFLKEIGEGADYPFGELLPLSEWWHHLDDTDSCRESLPWLQAPFELPESFGSHAEWEQWLAEWERSHPGALPPWAGTIALTEEGCGMTSVLIVNGPHAGRVCFIDFPKPPKLFPHANVLQWYASAHEAKRTRSYANFAP